MFLLELRGSSPRGVETTRGIRVRVVVLLCLGRGGTDGRRGDRSTMHRLTRPRSLALKEWSAWLTGSLMIS